MAIIFHLLGSVKYLLRAVVLIILLEIRQMDRSLQLQL